MWKTFHVFFSHHELHYYDGALFSVSIIDVIQVEPVVWSGPLRDMSTMSCEDLSGRLRMMSARLSVKTSVSVRAGMMIMMMMMMINQKWNIFHPRFSCRSATYDHLTRQCYLSEEDRFSQPDSFVPRQGADYLENQCESRQSRCEFSPQTRGQYLIYTDKSTSAFSDSSCRQSCSTELEFNCR